MSQHPLAGLSLRQILNKEPGLGDILSELAGFSPEVDDRSYAIIEGSKVESTLELLLRRSVAHMSKSASEQFFDKPDAICVGFSKKIYVAHAVQAIGKNTLKDLNAIRNVRNVFAHSKVHVDFTAPAVIDACKSLRGWGIDATTTLPPIPGAPELPKKDHSPARTAYGVTCDSLKRSMVAVMFPGGLASFGAASRGFPLD